MRHHAAAPSFGDPGGHPKSTKKRHEKQVLKKRSLKRPLGCHGEPRGAPGSQNEAKMDAKRLPKDVQKRRFFRIGRKTEKCKENILFTTLQPHRPHHKITIFGHFAGPKMTSKPRGDRMGPKCRQRAPQKPPERVQSPKLIPTGCQMGSQGPPKMSPKMAFWGSWSTGARPRGSRGSPGTPRGSKWSQNGTEIHQKWSKNRRAK